MTRRRPEDTTKRTTAEHIEHALAAEGDMNTIAADMETEGAAAILTGDVIPTEITGGDDSDLTELGFTLGEVVADDPLFRYATLPDGWTRHGSGHPYTSIHDPLGRHRISVFYKPDFWDRHADLTITTPEGYARHLVASGAEPVTDETWATPAALRAALTEIRDKKQSDLDFDLEHNRADRAQTVRAELDRCDRLIAQLAEAPG